MGDSNHGKPGKADAKPLSIGSNETSAVLRKAAATPQEYLTF
jgi:hypothetical protein